MKLSIEYKDVVGKDAIVIYATDNAGQPYNTAFILPFEYKGELIAEMFDVALQALMNHIERKNSRKVEYNETNTI